MDRLKPKVRYFNLTLSPALHRKVRMAAAKMDISERALMREALEQKIFQILGQVEEND